MPVLRANNFDGLVPRTEPHALADNQAQVAQNVKLYARELRPWSGPSTVATPMADAATIYKLYDYAGDSQWLAWTTDVDVALSPLVDTGDIRFYYTGDGVPKKSDYAMATGTNPPHSSYSMGVPLPVAAPSLSVTVAGSGTTQTRAYIYTFVSTFGSVTEESGPSPLGSIDVAPIGSTVQISGMDAAPSGSYNVTGRRIYRSVTGATTSSYQFVAEIAIATTTYDDTLTTAQLGAVIDTIGWRPPPDDMIGIINVGGGTGVLAGFTGNTICFSEPFFPHAWPVAYQLTVPWRIVGLAAFGSSVVVMTTGSPYIISGGTPGAMSMEMVQIVEPCVSKRSIVTTEQGVTYASPNGLVTIGSAGRGNVTRSLYHREEWSVLPPSAIWGAVLEDRYLAFFTSGASVDTALVLDNNDTPSLCTIGLSGPTCVHVDSRDAKVYYVNAAGDSILQLDANAGSPATYIWCSKTWYLPQATAWSFMRVRGDHTAGTVDIAIYADSQLITTITPTDDEPIRLPPFKGLQFFFQLTGTRHIREVTFATSMAELLSA